MVENCLYMLRRSETDLDFIGVALRNEMELLDTRTECKDLNFRTNKKTEITRLGEMRDSKLEKFCWIIRFLHHIFLDQLTWLYNKFA